MVVPSHFVPLAAPGMVAMGLKWMWNPSRRFISNPGSIADLIRWGCVLSDPPRRAHVDRCAPLLRDLHLASREAYQQFAAEGEDIGLVSKGLLMLCKESHTLDEEAAWPPRRRALGVPAEVLDAKAAARARSGNYDGYRRCRPLSAGLPSVPGTLPCSPAATGRANKARSSSGTPASRAGPRHRGSVPCHGRGEIEADEFILCGGIWSDRLIRGLGVRLPMQAGKGYSVTLPNPVERPALCSILTEARVAVTPLGDRLRFGGTMEMSGLDESISPRRVEGILRAASRYFPNFKRAHFDGIEPWHGLRPCSPDGMPYLGRSAAADNLLVATGHAMMGLSLAPVTGAIVARLLDQENPGFDLRPLNPDRFA